MSFAKWTWVGLGLAAVGWLSIAAAAIMGVPANGFLAGYQGQSPSQFLSIAGQAAVLSGFGIAILSAIMRGVHSLETLATELAVARARPQNAPSVESAPAPALQSGAATRTPAPSSQNASDIVSRGEISGREYVLFADGTVGVETLIGRRRFRTLSDARQFIGV